MKVLHVIPTLDKKRGGGDRACAELCEALHCSGLEIAIAFLHENDIDEFVPHGINLYGCKRSSTWLGRSFSYSSQMRRLLYRIIPQYDLIHIHGIWTYPNYIAARIAFIASRPYVIQPHGSLHPPKLRYKRFRKMLFGMICQKRQLYRADAIHAETDDDRDDILRYVPGAKVFVAPCGIFPERLSAPILQKSAAARWPSLTGRKIILFMGRIHPLKGVDILLKGFAASGMSSSGYSLLIVGPDEYGLLENFKKLAKTLGIAGSITWAGMVNDNDRRLALRECNIFILPSLSENFGISVLEALYFGKPVITTTATPWGFLEKAGVGNIVNPDIDAIAGSLVRMGRLSNKKLSDIAKRAKAIARNKYEWKGIAQRIKCIYREIIDGDQ